MVNFNNTVKVTKAVQSRFPEFGIAQAVKQVIQDVSVFNTIPECCCICGQAASPDSTQPLCHTHHLETLKRKGIAASNMKQRNAIIRKRIKEEIPLPEIAAEFVMTIKAIKIIKRTTETQARKEKTIRDKERKALGYGC